jgi:hypothetical protein
VLKIPKAKELFAQFLESIFCSENFIFYEEVSKFEHKFDILSISSDTQSGSTMDEVMEMSGWFFLLFDKFIADTGMMQVNLPSKLFKEISELAAELKEALASSREDPSDLFNLVKRCKKGMIDAQKSIFELMKTDSYPRFIDKHAEDLRNTCKTQTSAYLRTSGKKSKGFNEEDGLLESGARTKQRI